jgi:hypothetical protein
MSTIVVLGGGIGGLSASCYGPAYEYTFIMETELRKRKIRDKVPMVFVTPEPHVSGHFRRWCLRGHPTGGGIATTGWGTKNGLHD